MVCTVPTSDAVYETVTVGLFVAVREIVANDVGGTVSSVIASVTVAAVAGPAVPERSSAASARRRGCSVPLAQLEIETVRVEPVSAPGSKTQPVDVPTFVKSAAVMPVTDSLKVSVYTWGVMRVMPVNVVVKDETAGGVRSTVITVVLTAAAGPVLPTASAAPLAAKRSWSVPSEQLDTVTVRVAPVSSPGSMLQPVASPRLVKSPAVMPVTGSENVSVNVCVASWL